MNAKARKREKRKAARQTTGVTDTAAQDAAAPGPLGTPKSRFTYREHENQSKNPTMDAPWSNPCELAYADTNEMFKALADTFAGTASLFLEGWEQETLRKHEYDLGGGILKQ